MTRRGAGRAPEPLPRHWTPAQLQEACALWQRRLRLQDWQVSVGWGQPRLPDGSPCAGIIETLPQARVARIVLSVAEWHPADALLAWDPERTLLHELLHILFEPFDAPADSPSGLAEEQAIAALTEALLAAYRGVGVA